LPLAPGWDFASLRGRGFCSPNDRRRGGAVCSSFERGLPRDSCLHSRARGLRPVAGGLPHLWRCSRDAIVRFRRKRGIDGCGRFGAKGGNRRCSVVKKRCGGNGGAAGASNGGAAGTSVAAVGGRHVGAAMGELTGAAVWRTFGAAVVDLVGLWRLADIRAASRADSVQAGPTASGPAICGHQSRRLRWRRRFRGRKFRGANVCRGSRRKPGAMSLVARLARAGFEGRGRPAGTLSGRTDESCKRELHPQKKQLHRIRQLAASPSAPR